MTEAYLLLIRTHKHSHTHTHTHTRILWQTWLFNLRTKATKYNRLNIIVDFFLNEIDFS